MKSNLGILIAVDALLPFFLWANKRYPQSFAKSSVIVPDYVHYTSVGQLALTVTNFGLLGEGYNNPKQASCMYKLYPDNIKEQIEHISYGGLWIGGILNREKRVSTTIIDGVLITGAGTVSLPLAMCSDNGNQRILRFTKVDDVIIRNPDREE